MSTGILPDFDLKGYEGKDRTGNLDHLCFFSCLRNLFEARKIFVMSRKLNSSYHVQRRLPSSMRSQDTKLDQNQVRCISHKLECN